MAARRPCSVAARRTSVQDRPVACRALQRVVSPSIRLRRFLARVVRARTFLATHQNIQKYFHLFSDPRPPGEFSVWSFRFFFCARDGRLGLPRSDDDHHHHRGRRDCRVVVVRHRDRRQQDAVVERVDVPPMVESVLDVRRSGKILPTAVRSDEKAVLFGFGLWHQRRRWRWRQGHGHGTPANVHCVFRAPTAPAQR